jgi:hypothetical protein
MYLMMKLYIVLKFRDAQESENALRGITGVGRNELITKYNKCKSAGDLTLK